MTTITIKETQRIRGKIEAPSSKSYTHRAIISASLSRGESRIARPLISDDTVATLNACSLLGAQIKHEEQNIVIYGSKKLHSPEEPIDCKASASTIRLLTPVTALAKGKTILSGDPSLIRRPIQPLLSALRSLGVESTSHNGYPPVTVYGGNMNGGYTSIVGDISSQFVSGLLFACPLARHDTQMKVITPLESKPYVNLTLQILKMHKIDVNVSADFRRYVIPGQQDYLVHDHVVPGDFSSASFLMVAAVITNSKIFVDNLPSKHMPDCEILNIIKQMKAYVQHQGEKVIVKGDNLSAIDLDARDVPDLVPPCTVLACFASGITRIYNVKRLRIKESDRLKTLSSELNKMGADIVVKRDELWIKGPCKLSGTKIDPHYDHRIAMACAIAGLKAKGSTIIPFADCVNKSYPNFFRDLKKLGAKILVR